MSKDNTELHFSLSDNPIATLSECFAECNLPYEMLSDHCVALSVSGEWLEYDVAFTLQQGIFSITAQMPMHIMPNQHDAIYRLIGRMNADVPLGFFQLDLDHSCIEYRYSLPEVMLTSFSIDTIENLIESSVVALETLYPAAESLLTGSNNIETALTKYMHPAQGTA